MKLIVAQFLRSPWLAAVVHASLWLLLYFCVSSVGGVAPVYTAADGLEAVAQVPVPISKLRSLFTETEWPVIADPATKAQSIFGTTHFIPAPKPAQPPPTTRKIELTYQGFYSVDGRSLAMLKLGDKFIVAPIGSNVTANLFAAESSITGLVLTNPAGQTNLLRLNVKQTVEVPIK